MAVCVMIDGSGHVVQAAPGVCESFYLITPSELAVLHGEVTLETVALLGITPASLAQAYTAGFVAVIAIAALAWAVSLAVALIRKA